MKTRYVDQLKAGEQLDSQAFAVVSAIRAEDKNKQTYWDIQLADKTGSISGKIWADSAHRVSSSVLSPGRLVQVTARVDEYKGRLQLNISNVVSSDETRLDEYVRSSRFDAEEMLQKLRGICESTLKNPDLIALWQNLNLDSEMMSRFKFWPAGVSLHHEFRSGLLQHVMEMVKMMQGVEEYYPELDFEIVLMGIIWHDLGKLIELDANGLSTKYTLQGNLLGHIHLGVEILEKFFPPTGDQKVKLHIQHIILSHHGDYLRGSPVEPATAEAMLVHKLDNASADLRKITDTISEFAQNGGTDMQYDRHNTRNLWIYQPAKLSNNSEDTRGKEEQLDSEHGLVYSI